MIELHLIAYAGVLLVFIIAATILALCVVILACSFLVTAVALRVLALLWRLIGVIFKLMKRQRRSKHQAERPAIALAHWAASQSIEKAITPQSPATRPHAGHGPMAARNWKIPPVPTRPPRTVPVARPI